jgi:hypothetical protein
MSRAHPRSRGPNPPPNDQDDQPALLFEGETTTGATTPVSGRRRERPALLLEGGRLARWGFFVDEFERRRDDDALHYHPTGRIHVRADGSTSQVWEYRDQLRSLTEET